MANQAKQLARLVEADGCRVTLIQTNAPYWPRWIGRVRGLRALFRMVPYLRNLWRAAGESEVVHVMANSGWAWHLLAAPAIWIASLRGKRAIVNYRGGAASEFLSRQIMLVRPTLRRSARIIVPSRFLERVFSSYGVMTYIVPNIIDLARFQPRSGKTMGWHIVVTRNLEDIYDIPTALRAFALVHKRCPQARMTVVGSGPARESLERLVDELRLRSVVKFTGRLDNELMAAVYRDADLTLNSSLVDNMPISLLEAMASSVPIVSTNSGGIPDMVDDGKNALLVPVGDVEAMAAAALRVLSDPELAQSLREAGLETAKRYTWGTIRPLLYEAYAAAGTAGQR
jgi:glycosyltransferase involved in cell wall biosynthesis